MANNYFKYCTKEQEMEFLLSLGLWKGEEKEVLKILYSVSNHIEKHYEYLEIPKKDGNKRKLLAPDFLLKQIQKNILNHIIKGLSISKYATAYYKGSDIVKNAEVHLRKPIILKLDMKNFFDTITFEHVKSFVFKEEYFPEGVATILTKLCTYQNHLPQGAPTSPTISNIILKEFDDEVGNFCIENNITYTRYCDDMTFSGRFDKEKIISFVGGRLKTFGFTLNHKKTKLLTKGKRQIITGIVVNEYLNTPRIYRKEIRKQIYYCKKFGIEKHLQNIGLDIEKDIYLESLKGKILFVLHVNKEDIEFKNYLDWINKQ